MNTLSKRITVYVVIFAVLFISLLGYRAWQNHSSGVNIIPPRGIPSPPSSTFGSGRPPAPPPQPSVVPLTLQSVECEKKDWETYQNQEFNFEFSYPCDWVISDGVQQENGKNRLFVGTGPVNKSGIMIVAESTDFITLNDLKNETEKCPEIVRENIGCPLIEYVNPIVSNAGQSLTYDYAGEGGRLRIVGFLNNGFVYHISQFAFSEGQNDSLIINDIAKTFSILNP